MFSLSLGELWKELACENESYMDLLAYNLRERTVAYFLGAWDSLPIGSNTELLSAQCFSLACILLKYCHIIFFPSELFPQALLSWTLLSSIRIAILNLVKGVFVFYQHHRLHKATYLLGITENKCRRAASLVNVQIPLARGYILMIQQCKKPSYPKFQAPGW